MRIPRNAYILTMSFLTRTQFRGFMKYVKLCSRDVQKKETVFTQRLTENALASYYERKTKEKSKLRAAPSMSTMLGDDVSENFT